MMHKAWLMVVMCAITGSSGFVLSAQALSDTTAPIVGSVTPTSAIVGVEVNFRVDYSDSGSGIDYCRLLVDGTDAAPQHMSPVEGSLPGMGTMKQSYTFTNPGTHRARALCYDLAGNEGKVFDATITVAATVVDQSPPVVGVVSPTMVNLGSSETFSANYSDSGSGVTSCSLYLGGEGVTPRAMTIADSGSGVAKLVLPAFAERADLPAFVRCTDVAGNTGTGATVTISARSSDHTAPIVGSVTPASAILGVPVRFSASFSDAESGVTSCSLYLGSGAARPMVVDGSIIGTATYSSSVAPIVFAERADVSVVVRCTDVAGNIGSSAPVILSARATALTVGTVTPTVATLGVPVSFSVPFSDAGSVVTACALYVGGSTATPRAMTIMSSGLATYSSSVSPVVFAERGDVPVFVRCTDASGNSVTGATVLVSARNSDQIAPVVDTVTPTTAVLGVPVVFSASFSDAEAGVTSCSLSLGGVTRPMVITTGNMLRGTVTMTGTPIIFAEATALPVSVRCTDLAGNVGTSAPMTIAVSAPGRVLIPVAPVDHSLTFPVAPSSTLARASFAYSYNYRNSSSASQSVRVNRQMLDGRGRVIRSATVLRTLRAGASFRATISDRLYVVGNYTVRVRIFDARTGRALETGSFPLAVLRAPVRR